MARSPVWRTGEATDRSGGAAVACRQLGRNGLRMTVLALGTTTLGDAGTVATIGGVASHEGRALVDQALEAGVNLIA